MCRELYRVYIKRGPLGGDIGNAAAWREVAAGESEMPTAPKTYGMLPFPKDGIKVSTLHQGEWSRVQDFVG